jgi:hypothetical protein
MLTLILALALPITIQVLPAPDDPLGAAFAHALEQTFAGRADYPLAEDPKAAQAVVLVITAPVLVGQASKATAVSIAVLKAGREPVYLSGSVKVIPEREIAQRAQETSAEIRATLARLTKAQARSAR